MGRSKIRVKINRAGIKALMRSDGALAAVAVKGEAIAAACNEQSSWGGYYSAAAVGPDRARARVWSADNRNDEARDNRLMKNLDAG